MHDIRMRRRQAALSAALILSLLFLIPVLSGRVSAASLDVSELDLLVGQTYPLSLIGGDEETDIRFKSKNSGIASVSDDGMITAVSSGTTKVTCRTDSGSCSCDVSVYDPGSVDISNVLTGIDVSVWQGDVDYEKVKADGIDFVIMRAGYGVYMDSKFYSNYEKATAAGLMVGAYWYSTAKSISQLESEAEKCLEVIDDRFFDLPVYFDVEDSSQLKKGTAFCSKLVRKFGNAIRADGYDAGWYTATSFVNVIKESLRSSRRYSVWIAEHGPVNHYSGRYDIWQYSHMGHVDGVSTAVDMNWYFPDN